MKILVIEDEDDLREALVASLKNEQFVVETARDFVSATEKLSLYNYDCILLDIMLPGGSGLTLLDNLKKSGPLSGNVIIISAKGELEDKLRGLELGADDYLTKPFHLAELNARIKAVMRRKQLNGKSTLQLANLELDPDERTVKVNGQPLLLNRKEFDLLCFFLFNPNRLITKTSLAEHVWGDNIDQADSFDFVYYQIKNLRKKMQAAQAEIVIEAVYGIGYKMVTK